MLLPGTRVLNLLLVGFLCVCVAHELRSVASDLVEYAVPPVLPAPSSGSHGSNGSTEAAAGTRLNTQCRALVRNLLLFGVILVPLVLRNSSFFRFRL